MLPVTGLFGHIQRNNAKTLALLALFLMLLEATQIAVRLLPAALQVSLLPRINSQFDNIRSTLPDDDAAQRTLPDGTRPNVYEVSPSTKATGKWVGPMTGFGPMGGFVNPGPPTKKTGIAGVWETFSRDATFFKRDWYLIPIIGLIYVMASCWWSAQLMRYETRAKPLARPDAPDLYNLVENLALSMGMTCPRIEVIESPALNAYAAGFFPSSSTIAVTRGLIRNLTRDELEAVLAHEMVHIRDRDVRLMVMARACVDLVLPVSRRAVQRAKERPFLTAYSGIMLLLFLGLGFALMFGAIYLVITALAFGVRFAISRTREFTADAGAVELTKNPAALITALRKVARSEPLPLSGYATRAMMFSSPVETFLATHPPVEERVGAIMQHTRIAEHEIPDARLRPTATAAPAELPAAFGRRRVLQGLSGELAAQTTLAVARPALAPLPMAAASGFGRRGRRADGSSPGQRPIAEPLVRDGLEIADTNSDWFGRWVASGRIDRITGGAVKVLMLPQKLVAYIGLCALAISFLFSLTVFNPLLGLVATAVLVWFAWKRFARSVGSLAQRLAAYSEPSR
jgi:heat shock protein HtpX